MNLRIDSFKPLAVQLKTPSLDNKTESSSFGSMLQESLNEVNDLQAKADVAVENLVSGKSKNIHETMISISKADLAFRMTMQIRNKVIDAYQEVMRMNV